MLENHTTRGIAMKLYWDIDVCSEAQREQVILEMTSTGLDQNLIIEQHERRGDWLTATRTGGDGSPCMFEIDDCGFTRSIDYGDWE